MDVKIMPTAQYNNPKWKSFPWWLVATILLLGGSFYYVFSQPGYREALDFIVEGLPLTLVMTLLCFVIALIIGLLVGLAGRSRHVLFRNLATFYLAVIGGIPTIIMVFFVAFVAVPLIVDWLDFDSQQVTSVTRFVIALSLVYGAIFGDIFRLTPGSGSETTGPATSSRKLVRILVVLLITFIALLKDTSLATFLGTQEIAQQARLFAGSTFQFNQAYGVAILLYITLTIPIRLISQLLEQRFDLAGQRLG